MNKSKLESRFKKIILIYVLICWVVSSSSVIAAYTMSYSSEWREAFGQFGWVIELIRGGLVALGSAAILMQVFPGEGYQFFRFHGRKSQTLTLIRLVAISFVVLGTTYMAWHHFHLGPYYLSNPLVSIEEPIDLNGLVNPGISSHESRYFQIYKIPYLLYFPYSFVNFICLGVPAISVSLYASIKNLSSVSRSKKSLLIEFKNIDTSSNQNTKEVCRQFELFCINFIDIIGKYSVLFLIMAVMVIFEYRLGYSTQSLLGKVWTWIGYTLASSALLAIFIGFSQYADAFNKCSRTLINMKGEIDEFESSHSVPRILNRILIRHLSLYIALAILLATFAFLSPLGRILGLPI